jgi:uncharacterized membrane protein YhaH (DUF805 family)
LRYPSPGLQEVAVFSGELDRSAFAYRILLRALLCLVGAPLLLFGILGLSCTSGNNACFTAGIFVGMFGAHLVYLLFMASSIGPVIRRLRRLQLPVWLVALPIVFFLADVQNGSFFIHAVITGVAMPGGASSARLGVIPRYFLLAIVSLLVLWILPDRERTEQNLCERWGIPGMITFGAFVLLGIGAIMEAIRTASILLQGVGAYQAVSNFMRYYYLYSSPIILLILAILTARWQKRTSP